MKARTHQHANVHQILKFLWGGSSILLLILGLYYTWQQERIHNHQVLNYTAEIIGNQMDGLINELIQSVHISTINDHDIKNCNHVLLPVLQQQVFNNPQISGIAISNNKQQIVCSTLVQNSNPPIQKTRALMMYGPVQLKNKNKPVFIIQQRLGQYNLAIYVIKDVIEEALQTQASIAKRITLFDRTQNKTLLQLVRHDKSGIWQTSEHPTYITNALLTSNTNPLLTSTELANLTNLDIILLANPNNITHFSWLQGIIIGLLILSLSLFIYYYLRLLVNNHFSLHRAIRQAVKNNQFFPVYQPIFDLNANDYCGIEVLLRWRTGENEIITPDFFIEEAERSGLIVPMTLQLLEKVFNECHHLLRTHKHFHLAINLSAIHFTHTYFLDSLRDLCRKHQISSQQLILELTERDLLTQNDSLLISKMNDLRLSGFSLAVDDFGTGYASIGYLQHFPFNYLKIDQLFIRAIGTGAITETLNQSIIQMAKNLKLNVIAEGVETLNQVDFLQSHGVNLMQGWYFASAMSMEQLIILIESKGISNG